MAEMIIVGSGSEMSLLRQCAQACVDNGGEWYSPQQALAILGDFVGNPALLADSAYIGMAKPECVLRLLDQRSTLITAAQRVIRAFEALGRAGDLDIMQRRECENAMVALKDATANATEAANG